MRLASDRPREGYHSVIVEDASRRERYRSLTEGIRDDNRRRMIESCCDNILVDRFGKKADFDRAKKLLQGVEEANVVADFDTYTMTMLPIVTRAYWALMLPNLISTQPLNGPTGRIFYDDTRYASSGGLYDPSMYTPGARTDRFLDPYYALAGENPGDNVREIEVTITSEDVSVESRKLNASWSDEVEQDLRAYFGIEMDDLMVGRLGDELAREVDQTGIDRLIAGATAGNVNWDETPSGAYSSLDPKIYAATLFDAFTDADQLIQDAVGRRGEWLLMGSTEVNRLRKLGANMFVEGGEDGGGTVEGAMVFVGRLAKKWDIYEARHFPANKILVGYRGASFSQAGAVFGPYIPLVIKDAVKDLVGDKAYQTIRGASWRGCPAVIVNGDAFATVTIT